MRELSVMEDNASQGRHGSKVHSPNRKNGQWTSGLDSLRLQREGRTQIVEA